MRYLVLIFSLLALNSVFSQNIIEIFENTLNSAVDKSHSEMKSLGLKLSYVQDRDKFIVFIYSQEGNSGSISSGSIILKDDFKTVLAFSLLSTNKELTEMLMKFVSADNYTYKKIKDNGEIVYSNGVYDLGFKTESSSSGNEYRVSISRINSI